MTANNIHIPMHVGRVRKMKASTLLGSFASSVNKKKTGRIPRPSLIAAGHSRCLQTSQSASASAAIMIMGV